ncbi:PAAR-like protein [Sinomicrobium weinanense]|uniref:DUF4280 domain-containing protein n=1 Tax=Sinomicrobium weinanense TaxID=2842200 RepID=A0A926JPH4_9FLAO|nr:PAAR-like protein [Sinomicrobium weinanense]MBC9795075.1 DUF4280 domain-containing protein [Sinomicrobium weinanense]MBU3123796.1 DUF4280 domain-containing protein [Sinomicrobium weinanense]
MAQSYIPEGTEVICTMMQKGPNKIGINRTSYVVHKSENAPLLNKLDKKISDSFQCKNASKFWGGLSTLCAGIAIGALVVAAVAATVLTGGAAAVFIVAAAGTALVSLGAGVTGLYKAAHDCDATLESQWQLLHETVNIDGEQAVLNRSFISCVKGGKVSLIVDPVIAKSAAEQIINNNENEVSAHLSSQFVMGLITGAVSASPAALAVSSPLAIYSYNDAESKEQEQRAQQQERDPFLTRAGDAAKNEARNTTIGLPGGFVENVNEVTKINRSVQSEMIEYGQQAVAREAAGDVAGAANARLAQDIASRSFQTPWKSMLKGLGWGLAAGAVNFGIDEFSNSYEDRMHVQSLDVRDNADRSDSDNNVGIIATDL